MFVRLVLVACVVLSASSSLHGVRAQCSGFQCGSGECLYIMKKCDGVPDCADGSDEDVALCSASTFKVAIGVKDRVKVQYRWFNGLNFDLCNSKNCSTFDLAGYSADGGLNYFGYVGCDQRARHCRNMYSSRFYGNGETSTGEFIFGLERRRDGLSLWKDGHPLKNIWIPTPQDYDQLTIRPSWWYTDLSIEFSDFNDKLECTNLEYQCPDGQCISLLDKCNGVKDCSDGADEERAACDLASVDLTEETKIVATVQFRAEHRGIIFLFCNNTGCNNVRLTGCSDSGGFWYTTAQVNCNLEGAFCNGGSGSRCLYEESLPNNEMRFEITLTSYTYSSSEQNIEMRTQDGDYSRSLSITKGYNQLRIKPDLWNSDMPVKFDAIPLITSTTASSPSTAAASTPSTATASTPSSAAASTPSTATSSIPSTAAASTPSSATASTPSSATATTSTSASVVSTTSPSDWPPTPAPSWCDPVYEYLLIPVVGVCDAYTVCFSGRSQRMPCPAPLQFNYQLQTCDWPYAVQCV